MKTNFPSGDMEHIEQRIMRAISLARAIEAVAMRSGGQVDPDQIHDLVHFIDTELHDVLAVVNDVHEMVETGAVPQ